MRLITHRPSHAAPRGGGLQESLDALRREAEALMRGLGAPEGGGAMPWVKLGDRREEVKELQRRLKGAGFDPGPVDGYLGPKTEKAVKAFQRARGLVVDGEVGPQTWGALGLTGAPRNATSGPTPAPEAAPAPTGALWDRRDSFF